MGDEPRMPGEQTGTTRTVRVTFEKEINEFEGDTEADLTNAALDIIFEDKPEPDKTTVSEAES